MQFFKSCLGLSVAHYIVCHTHYDHTSLDDATQWLINIHWSCKKAIIGIALQTLKIVEVMTSESGTVALCVMSTIVRVGMLSVLSLLCVLTKFMIKVVQHHKHLITVFVNSQIQMLKTTVLIIVLLLNRLFCFVRTLKMDSFHNTS